MELPIPRLVPTEIWPNEAQRREMQYVYDAIFKLKEELEKLLPPPPPPQ